MKFMAPFFSFAVAITLLLLFPSDLEAKDDRLLISQSIAKKVNAARSKTRREDFDGAIRIYDKALWRDDLSDQERNLLWQYRAQTMIRMGQPDDALNTLLRLEFNDSTHDQGLLKNLIYLFGTLDRYDLSSALLERHGTGFAHDNEVHYTTVISHHVEAGKMDLAFDVLADFAAAMPDLEPVQELYAASFETQNREAVLLARFPPIMPAKAKRSGECSLTVAVDAEGNVSEVTETDCTERVFEKSAETSVKTYKFLPKLVDGQAVPSSKSDLKVTYRLADSYGRIIPSR